jgi:hypothetical protein
MTDDYLDYERERWLDELYEEYRPQAVEDFTTDRLRSYYLENQDIARPCLKHYWTRALSRLRPQGQHFCSPPPPRRSESRPRF